MLLLLLGSSTWLSLFMTGEQELQSPLAVLDLVTKSFVQEQSVYMMQLVFNFPPVLLEWLFDELERL